MTLKCIIVDDEQHAIDVLKAHIAKVPKLEIKLSTTNPIEAYTYVQANNIDLIFLDIQMPELTGLQFLGLLNEKTKVILTTAYREHAVDGYEYNVADYLLKPVLFPRFLKAVSRIINNESETPPEPKPEKEYIFVKTGIRNKVIKIDFEKILYIESMGNYVHFIMHDAKITSLMPLKEVEQKLPKSQFMRIHQSFIVAKKNILGREGNQILIPGQNLPIGETYKKNVKDFFSKSN
jgi:DNA-binding LytR/AlgR family response regulator